MIGYNLLVNSKTAADSKGDGEAISILKQNFGASAAPSVTDDESKDYQIGSYWIINKAGDAKDGYIYKCTDASTGSANWDLIVSGNNAFDTLPLEKIKLYINYFIDLDKEFGTTTAFWDESSSPELLVTRTPYPNI